MTKAVEQITTAFVIFLFLYQVLQILVSRNTLQFILDNLFDFLLDKMQEKLNDMMRRDDELERMRRGKSVKSCFLQLLYIFAVFYLYFNGSLLCVFVANGISMSVFITDTILRRKIKNTHGIRYYINRNAMNVISLLKS